MPAKGAHELPIDEGRDTGVLGPWAEIVRRDQAIDDGIHRCGFGRREEQIAAGHNRRDRIGLVWLPRQHLGHHPRADALGCDQNGGAGEQAPARDAAGMPG